MPPSIKQVESLPSTVPEPLTPPVSAPMSVNQLFANQPCKSTVVSNGVVCAHASTAGESTSSNANIPRVQWKYGDILRDLAARGHNWGFYDENFCYLKHQSQQQILKWD